MNELMNIIVDDRHFVKIVDDEEIDTNINDIKQGDVFAIYSDKTKEKKLHWGDIFTFVCEGTVITNVEGVSFMLCSEKLEE